MKIRNTGRTHWKPGHKPWNKGLVGTVLKPRTGRYITCLHCSKEKYFQLNELKKRDRKYCSLSCYHEASRREDLTYSAIHARMIRDYGKADVCEKCESKKTVDWANVSGNYLLDRSDWKKLCRKCHVRHDRANNNLAFKNFNKKQHETN